MDAVVRAKPSAAKGQYSEKGCGLFDDGPGDHDLNPYAVVERRQRERA